MPTFSVCDSPSSSLVDSSTLEGVESASPVGFEPSALERRLSSRDFGLLISGAPSSGRRDRRHSQGEREARRRTDREPESQRARKPELESQSQKARENEKANERQRQSEGLKSCRSDGVNQAACGAIIIIEPPEKSKTSSSLSDRRACEAITQVSSSRIRLSSRAK